MQTSWMLRFAAGCWSIGESETGPPFLQSDARIATWNDVFTYAASLSSHSLRSIGSMTSALRVSMPTTCEQRRENEHCRSEDEREQQVNYRQQPPSGDERTNGFGLAHACHRLARRTGLEVRQRQPQQVIE